MGIAVFISFRKKEIKANPLRGIDVRPFACASLCQLRRKKSILGRIDFYWVDMRRKALVVFTVSSGNREKIQSIL